jgi:hypothetical protein
MKYVAVLIELHTKSSFNATRKDHKQRRGSSITFSMCTLQKKLLN